jgi:hypothetical protein
MNQRLCQTFQEIAHQTFDMLGRARSVEHQPLEETLTDITKYLESAWYALDEKSTIRIV